MRVEVEFTSGQNRGWQWHGAVYGAGRYIWSGRVAGSIGVRGLLIKAGIINEGEQA